MPRPKNPKTAPQFLAHAVDLMRQRGETYDKPAGERSAAATARAFNAITGRDLAAADIWLMLALLKMVRQHQVPGFHRDSAEDLVAYASLYAEAGAAADS